MKRAIVSGATGIIGRRVCQELRHRNVDVWEVRRPHIESRSHTGAPASGTQVLEFDLAREASAADVNQLPVLSEPQAAVFYHFAWFGPQGLTRGSVAEQLRNSVLTVNAINLATRLGCGKFVNAGSFEETLLEESIRGGTALRQISLDSIPQAYALAKLASRDLGKLRAYHSRIDYVHTRFSAPLALEKGARGFIDRQLENLAQGRPVERPTNKNLLNFISLDTLARAYCEVGAHAKGQEDHFISTNLFTTLEEFLDYAAALKAYGAAKFPYAEPPQFSKSGGGSPTNQFSCSDEETLAALRRFVCQ